MQRLSCICFHKIVYRSYKSFLDTISNPVKVHYKQKIYFLKSYTYLISLLSWYILGSILIIPTKKPFTYFLFQFLVVSSNASVSRYIEAFGLGREGGKKGKYKCWKLRLSALSTSAEALWGWTRLLAVAFPRKKKYQIDILCWPFHAPKLRASAFYCSSTKILWGIRDIDSAGP